MTTTQSEQLLPQFISYLRTRGVLSGDQLSKVSRFQQGLDSRVGTLAMLKGLIGPKDLFDIVAQQAAVKGRFGEIAIEKGLLKQEQLDELLSIQRNPLPMFAECLWMSQTLSEGEARRRTQEFLAVTGATPITQSPAREGDGSGVLQTLRRPGDGDRVRLMLSRLKKVSTLPVVVQNVLSLVEKPEVRLDEVARVLQGDPALSAQVLKLVNSGLYGLRGSVDNVLAAVRKIGLNGVRGLVLTASMINQFRGKDLAESKATWSESILCGQWALNLARLNRVPGAEAAQSAGLLHRIGSFVVAEQMPAESVQASALIASGVSVDVAEAEAFGLTVPEIGAYLTHYWDFPESITQAINYHRAVPGVLRSAKNLLPSTRVVNAAVRVARLSRRVDFDEALSSLEDDFVGYHGLERGKLLELAPRVGEAADNLLGILFA